ncbi:MAG: hypothetical protein WCH85_03920 [Methanomicrobiales archaeon]
MNDMKIAIRVCNPGKKYTLGRPQEHYLTLRDAIVISLEKNQQYASASFTGGTCQL